MIFEHTSQAGGIHQPQTGIILKRWEFDIYHFYVFFIGWIFGFRGKIFDIINADLRCTAVKIPDNCLFPFPILKACNDRSNRYDADGENGFADKTV